MEACTRAENRTRRDNKEQALGGLIDKHCY